MPAQPRPATSEWAPWLAPVALVGGLVLALIGAAVIDIPAVALGAKLSTSHESSGLTLANTFVQDLAFVGAAVLCAHIGAHRAGAADFGLRPPRVRLRTVVRMVLVLLGAFLLASIVWAAIVHPPREKLLEKLGSDVVLAGALTCVVAPICEEFLFRGFIFTALRNWHGTMPAAVITGLLFGAVHAGSAPALDLVPLAVLGFGLCLLYRATGSLYPCIFAHSLNNSIAFWSLEEWDLGEGLLLLFASFAGIAAVLWLVRVIEARQPRGIGSSA